MPEKGKRVVFSPDVILRFHYRFNDCFVYILFFIRMFWKSWWVFFMTTFDICSFSNMATETHFVNHIRTCGIFDIFWKMSILKNKKVLKHLALASFFHSKSLDKLKWYTILNFKKKNTSDLKTHSLFSLNKNPLTN